MGVVSILLSFNVNAKMSEGDYVDKICKGSIEYTLDNKTRECPLQKVYYKALYQVRLIYSNYPRRRIYLHLITV
jgi:hypothetical protein